MREKNLLVLSDTHGRRYAIDEVMDRLTFRPSAVLFLGDGLRDLSVLDAPRYEGIDLYAVAGNCDSFGVLTEDVPSERMVDVDGCRILMMHGHTRSVGSGQTRAIYRAAELGADVLLFGHTHRPCSYTVSADKMPSGKMLTVGNPGSLGEPRDGGEPSFGVLTVRDGVPLFSHGSLD